MDRRIHWYVFRSRKHIPRLKLTFSPRSPGNKWLLHEKIIEDLPIIKVITLDDVGLDDDKKIVEKTWELISEVLEVLYNNEYNTLSYLINNKVKIILHLERAGFKQTQHFQLAEVIEDHEFQDFIIPRIHIK